ncbi:hypothetical protein BDW74DRAFT_175742 [Aspergillus multicolor]|uniref:uncharacterized protein n=1 Tax=Aspergillus multicolor TaxID=41759 RepID=UPI003CCDAB03
MQFVKGVGIRICYRCQPGYTGMMGMGCGGGVGMGMGMGYSVNLGMGFRGFISSEAPAVIAPGVQGQGQGQGQRGIQGQGPDQKINLDAEEKAALEQLATDAMQAIHTSISITPTPTLTPTSPTPSDTVIRSDSNIMVRRRGPKTDLRRLLPYPNPAMKRRMAVSSPVPGPSSRSASAEGPSLLIPSPTPSPTRVRMQEGKCQVQNSECGRVIDEMNAEGDGIEARVLLLQCETALGERVGRPALGVEGRDFDEKTTIIEPEVADGENDGINGLEKEGNVYGVHALDQTRGFQVEDQSGIRTGSRHRSMDDRVERQIMA